MSRPVLYLFSSNRRPRYSQDILDVVAMPAGLVKRFRYSIINVPANLRDAEAQRDLAGAKVIVNFSLQQEARYHDPVFFPVRGGEVIDVHQAGDVLIVRFKLGGLMCLPTPPESDDPEERRNSFRQVVQSYTDAVTRAVGAEGIPYRASLGSGADVSSHEPPHVVTAEHPLVELRWTAEYLSRTETFRGASFLHIIGIDDADESWVGTAADKLLDDSAHSYRLVGGRTYFLHVLQRQAAERDATATFRVDTNSETVSVIGEETFSITSPYDRIVVPLQVHEPKDGLPTETSITVEAVGSQGPSARIPVVVDPSFGGTGAAATTAFGVALIGLAGFAADVATWQRAVFVGGALMGLGVAVSRGVPVLTGLWHRRRSRRPAPA